MKRLGLSSGEGLLKQLRANGARAAMALAMVAGACVPVLAEGYPTRAVTLVVPFPAGGGTDTLARPLVEQLKERLGQPVIIDNRGGGGSNIGNSAAARSTADGYTLLINTDTMAVLPLLFNKLTYDPINDLTPVGYIASVPMVIAMNPKVPVNTVQDLIDKARQDNASLNYANVGTGTPQHLAFELLCRAAGIKINQAGYRGAGPAINDVVAGHIQFGVFTLGSVLPQIEAGNMRALAVLGDKRHPAIPNVPTIVEAGYKDVQVPIRYILFAPKGMPPAIMAKLNKALESSIASPEMINVLSRNAYEPLYGPPEEISKLMRDENARWSPIIKELGLRLD
jgi:tripartite-type tricarboxylate transporter receptor subunit TctC